MSDEKESNRLEGRFEAAEVARSATDRCGKSRERVEGEVEAT